MEKSASIGVRGEITAKYLSKLGFKNHIRITGCPSMFSKGKDLKINVPKNGLSYASKVSFNAQKDCEQFIWDFFERSFRYFKDYYYVAQDAYDLRLLYAGQTSAAAKIHYPCNSSHSLIQENRMKFFVNVASWLEFLSQMDFSIGVKIHGTVLSTLAGTPAFLIAHDARTRELAEYHNIPHMKWSDINEKTNLYNIYETIDFSQVERGHEERFNNFVDFLNENGLDNIYVRNERSVFDEKLKEIDFYPMVESILHVDSKEVAQRLDLYYGHINRRIEKLQNKVKKLSE